MPVTRLTSTRNPRVREAAALARRRERRAAGRHLVEGPHALAEALDAGVVETVFVATAPSADPARRLDELGLPAERCGGVEVVAVAEHVLAQLADTRSPQGVVGLARDVTVGLEQLGDQGLVVVLDRLADPGNVGTVVRTARAAGATGVVCLRGTSDVLGPKAVRAAAGATYHLPIVVEVEAARALEALRSRGRGLVGLDGAATASVFDLTSDDQPLAMVLGSEAHGLDDAVRACLDRLVAVPMHGGAESLNVAVAAGVAIYAAATASGRSGRPRR